VIVPGPSMCRFESITGKSDAPIPSGKGTLGVRRRWGFAWRCTIHRVVAEFEAHVAGRYPDPVTGTIPGQIVVTRSADNASAGYRRRLDGGRLTDTDGGHQNHPAASSAEIAASFLPFLATRQLRQRRSDDIVRLPTSRVKGR